LSAIAPCVAGAQSGIAFTLRSSSGTDASSASAQRVRVLGQVMRFDAADPDATCPVRFTTTQPTQALGMLNGEFLNEQARVFADDLRRQAGEDPPAQVRLALRRVAQREPSAPEVERGVAFLARLREQHRLAPEEALRSYCLLALNLNEFVYLN